MSDNADGIREPDERHEDTTEKRAAETDNVDDAIQDIAVFDEVSKEKSEGDDTNREDK